MVDNGFRKLLCLTCSAIAFFASQILPSMAEGDSSQSSTETATKVVCINAFAGQPPETFKYTVVPTDPAKIKQLPPTDPTAIVTKIEETMGLGQRILVYPASGIETACATIVKGSERRVYYGREWLERYSGGSYWVMVGVLAHEIGHHVNSHSLANDVTSWRKEYEADVFLGTVVRLMGGTLDDALSSIAHLEPAEGDENHPPRVLREAAIRSGYERKGSSQEKGQHTPVPVSTGIASLWNSPNTYCDVLVGFLLKPFNELAAMTSANDRFRDTSIIRPGGTDIQARIFNPRFGPEPQCKIESLPNAVYLASCTTNRESMQEFRAAYARGLGDVGKCLQAHDWKPVSTTQDAADTGLPEEINFERIFSDVSRPPQRVGLRRAPAPNGDRLAIQLMWEVY